jgi:medium-chain acyl-[acyl-carrier-protein] hydrolase
MTTNPWLVRPKVLPQAALRLFCFPYAGGGALTYRSWAEKMPLEVEVCAVELPGRGLRLREPLFTQMLPLAEAVAHEIGPYLDKPFAFFGHSMGAILAFEVARILRSAGKLEPALLSVSGRAAPQVVGADPMTYGLPEPQFLRELQRLNGTPKEVLEHPELMQMMLPLLRADFEVIQTYPYRDQTPLTCPISVYGGLQDKEVTLEDLEAWRQQTTGSCSVRFLPGDHFFINTAQPFLLQTLTRQLYEHNLLGRLAERTAH